VATIGFGLFFSSRFILLAPTLLNVIYASGKYYISLELIHETCDRRGHESTIAPYYRTTIAPDSGVWGDTPESGV